MPELLPVIQDSHSCGTCTMCCKLLGIAELKKPRNVWCSYCEIGKGCKIYADKPASCSTFECAWLQDPNLPEELRPDRSKVVMFFPEAGDGMTMQAHVDPSYSDSWRAGPISKFLDVAARAGMKILLTIGDRRRMMASVRDEDVPKFLRELEVKVGPEVQE